MIRLTIKRRQIFLCLLTRGVSTHGPRSIRRSGRAGQQGTGWIIPTQCSYRSVSAGAALTCMSSRASVRFKLVHLTVKLCRGADGTEEKKFASCGDTTARLYFIVDIKACVFVCACGRGEVTRTDAFSINYCVTLRAAQVSLHLQQHR